MASIHCSYINLDQAVGRRLRLEANFREYMQDQDCELTRIPALGQSVIHAIHRPRNLTGSELGCIYSHCQAITSALQNSAPGRYHLICEDDCKFGEHSARLMRDTLHHMNSTGTDWDLIFTSVAIGCSTELGDLIDVFEYLLPRKLTSFQRGHEFTTSGASAYLLNPRSAAKLLPLFQDATRIKVPIDIYFRDLSKAGKIKTFFTFPFITGLDTADCASYIQTSNLPVGQTLGAFSNIYCINTPDAERKQLIADMESRIRSDALRAYGAACASYRQLNVKS